MFLSFVQVKENVESRPRLTNSSNRGSKGVADRGSRGGSTHISSNGLCLLWQIFLCILK